MAFYPGSEQERRVPRATLHSLVATLFQKCGMSEADAAVLGDSLVDADLRGIHSHGTLRVPDYVAKLRHEGVDPRGRPQVATDTGAVAVVDGGNSMGAIGGVYAMDLAIEKARSLGIGAVAVRGSNHCGAMDFFVRRAVKGDCIGLATTNALCTMAPWGGVEKIVGINPLAVGLPAGRAHPVVLDAAFSSSSHGKIRVYHQKGAQLPEGWAFDRNGVATTDPAAALEGLLQPIGQYKGVGLAIISGLLSSLLSGAAYGTELGDMVKGPAPGKDGHFFLAINVAAFTDRAEFEKRVDTIVEEIEQSARAPGVDRLFAPGGLEAELAERYEKEGIPLNEETRSGIAQAARELQVTLPPEFA